MKIKTYNNQFIELNLPTELAGKNLIAIPGIIDPHVHLRTPGAEHKENWETGAQAAISGGITTVFDMPNNSPTFVDEASFYNKKKIITEQLEKIKIPLNYHLYIGATGDNEDEIKKMKNHIIGIKLFMGSSTGNLLVADQAKQEKIFQLASELDLVLALHAENETIIQAGKQKFPQPTIADHSKIRDRQAAITAVDRAIQMAKKYNTKTYICHVSTREELDLIRTAKKEGTKIYTETTPHHLFLSKDDYPRLGTLGQMNPPLRTKDDQTALWEAINDGTIDTIGTDHAPHTLEEKNQAYPASPSGVPGMETVLPLLLNAYYENKISLEKIVKLTRTNIEKIFNLKSNSNWTILDLDLEKEVKNENLKTKCHWSPFAGQKLKGWPIAVIINDKIYQ